MIRPEFDVVLVRWVDAGYRYELARHDGWHDDGIVSTTGFLLSRADGWLTLAGEVLPGVEGFRAVSRIPEVLIESCDVVRRGTA